jgi:hypothetical protein
MKLIYCPVCSRAISSQAVIKHCPHCYHPLNVHEWIEVKAEKTKKENAVLEEQLSPEDKKERFKTIKEAAIIQAYNKQKDTNGWTFYNEHELVQRTLENRFNFLLIAYSLFLTAYFQAKDRVMDKFIILLIGFSLIVFLFIAIYRTTNRFLILLDIVHSLEKDDVGPIIHRENGCRHKSLFNKCFRKNSIMGKVIPSIMCVSFGIGIMYHICFDKIINHIIIFIKGVFK